MSNPMYHLGIKYNTDKVTRHKYDHIYNMFLQSMYNTHGSMLEIGINSGKSLMMWLELFPNSHIYGMDIDKEYSGDRHTVIKGDQSNSSDLENVLNSIKDKKVFFINDDGSHIPEHQLLSFNTLFPIIMEDGVYIIEDIETSYWTKNNCYGYQTRYGYKHPNSIIEIFKEVADSINSEFAGKRANRVKHHNMIGSITFAKNCIIITKKIQEDRDYIFSHNL
jgi:hypothetical protein